MDSSYKPIKNSDHHELPCHHTKVPTTSSTIVIKLPAEIVSMSLAVLSLIALYFTALTKCENMLSNATQSRQLMPMTYELLPLGTIKPLGWIKDQLQLEAEGLAGNLYEFYRFVKQSQWLGGEYEYSELHESAPYWYNGIVPLAYTMDDDRLKAQVNDFLSYVLNHQAADGWLGPETTKETRGIWARCLLLQGLMNHAIADPTKEESIVDAMFKYTVLANSMLKANYTGFIQQPGDDFDPFGFGVSRAHEFSTTLQWLYEKYPGRNDNLLWETMELMWSGAEVAKRDWTDFFVDGVFPTTVPSKGQTYSMMHGVNIAEGLRYPFQLYRMTGNESLIQQSRDAVNMTYSYQGSLSGTIIADEYIGGLSPERGSELCMSVESIFSLSYLYRAIGDNSFADRAELIAFNALPAAISADWWSHQYITQTNQPWSKNITGNPWYNVNSQSITFGLEPNFPCCTVNHPQAYPKFLMSSVVRKSQSGIVHQFLIPFSADITLPNGITSITCNTKYPFGESLQYNINTDTAFDFYIRVPSWSNASTFTQGDKLLSFVANGDGLFHVAVNSGTSNFTVTLDAGVRTVQRENNTVGVYRGALLYSLDIDFNTSSHQALEYSTQTPLPENQTVPQSVDYEYIPSTPWAVGIDPSQIDVRQTNESDLKNPIFERGAPPIHLEVTASEILWPLDKGTASIPSDNVTVVGEPFTARLIPYGSAKLHIAQLPVLDLKK